MIVTEQTQHSSSKPRIVVSDLDYRRLTELAAAAHARFPAVAEELQTEMDRAQVVSAAAVPADAVRMGSTVEFRFDNGEQRRVTLVFPGEADIAENRVSILTPIGAALIGLSTGQSITWLSRDGRERELTIVNVGQPESALLG